MKKLLLCIVTLGAFACMSGVALGARTYSAEAFIQSGNEDCGENLPNLPGIGVATYHRTGNIVKVAFDLQRGIPDSKYGVSLWGRYSFGLCMEVAFVGALGTNKRGEGYVSGEVEVPAESTSLFATGEGPDGYNDTTAVTLP
jgi:hypothetical protein